MIQIGVQQLMLSSLTGSDEALLETLKRIKEYGFDSIELNSFMVHPSSFLVRALTKAAGMGVGKAGKRDWKNLVPQSGLKVISLHSDLGSIERDVEAVAKEALEFGTDKVVITGMYRYDYTSSSSLSSLSKRLSEGGKRLKKCGVSLLYHNHNIETVKDERGRTALDVIINETDEEYVSFELDTYWLSEAGCFLEEWMKKMGNRLKIWHIADRGWRGSGKEIAPIVKSGSVELGTGNLPLERLLSIAKELQVQGIVLESHNNWINDDPMESIRISGQWLKKNILKS